MRRVAKHQDLHLQQPAVSQCVMMISLIKSGWEKSYIINEENLNSITCSHPIEAKVNSCYEKLAHLHTAASTKSLKMAKGAFRIYL